MTKIEVAYMKPSALHPNSYNPNEMSAELYQKAIASIQEFGFVDPITARSSGEIIDGEHRWRASLDLGLAEIPVIVLDVDDAEAESLTIVLNELRGKPNSEKLASLIADLATKRSMADLERVLPLRRQQLAEMVASRKDAVDWDSLQRKPEQAEDKERWVERVYRLPTSAASVLDEALAKVRQEGVTEDWRALEMLAAEFLGS